VPNVLAWGAAMPVIVAGAMSPTDGWSLPAVVPSGTVTGAVAGAVLGLVSGWFLPSRTGPSPHNRVVLAVLASPAHRLLDRSLVGLRVRGVVSGIEFSLPAQYARADIGLVVVPGHAERKRWWRNLRRPAPVEVLVAGRWRPGTAQVLRPGDERYDAVATYRRRWRRVEGLGQRSARPDPPPCTNRRPCPLSSRVLPLGGRTPGDG
jgi:hypothetical protein